MQLTGPQSLAEGLVASPATSRPASVDLTVGKVVLAGKEHEHTVDIKPQQMFIIISKERVNVRPGYVGYAMPKTSLCKEGILCLNTGILDPGYNGPISTTAINFEEKAYPISPNEPFLRLVFHKLEGTGAEAAQNDISKSDEQYLKEAKSDSRYFPETFLNIPGHVQAIADKISAGSFNSMVKWLTFFTVIFALWNLGGYLLLGRQSVDISSSHYRLDELNRQLDSARAELRALHAAVCASYARDSSAAKSGRTATPATSSRPAGCP